MSAKWKVDLSEFNSGLKKLSKAAQGEALRDTIEAGARVIQANAMINANEVFSSNATNALANSITVETTGRGTNWESRIGPTVVYGRIHELGGVIKPVIAKMLHWVEDGVDIFARSVTIPPRPYLRPAVDGHETEIVGAMKVTLAARIRRALG